MAAQTRSSSNLTWNILSYAVLIFLAVLSVGPLRTAYGVEPVPGGALGLRLARLRPTPSRASTFRAARR